MPIGGHEENVIVGDVEIQLLLNEDGSLRARVFNRENDISYLGEGIGYKQGVGLTYEVDFNTFKELLQKIIKSGNEKKNDALKTNQTEEELPDDDFGVEFLKFQEKRREQNKTENKEKPD